ncbi:MAG: aminomethyl-transferring glycine dehydrogenase [Flavobacteriales bacterium]|nr:aminomethyl-transferring glycine dehydrogenase [Flavobacteriales bacterium]
MSSVNFAARHIGPRKEDLNHMLETVGVGSLDELIDKTIPSGIRLKKDLEISKALSEQEYLNMLQEKASMNKVCKNYIGMGYYPTVVPPTIQRNILENPGWYTAYTPYQAEIAQGRLEALLNFQTMVSDLTGFEIANASLLDEGTAVSEAMIMFFNSRKRDKVKAGANKMFVDSNMFPQTIDVVEARAIPLGIEVVVGNIDSMPLDDSYFGVAVQYPGADGEIKDYRAAAQHAHDHNALVVAACDIMSLALITPPADWGADVAVGNSQRFGVPMGFGGPHAAFFATSEDFKRNMPGRIIGVSKDRLGNPGYRMALQTREQHIRREKATSNICTAQALLAVMASMYAVYHGPDGIRQIAGQIHGNTKRLAASAELAGLKVANTHYFDTLTIEVASVDAVKQQAEKAGINLCYPGGSQVRASLHEGMTDADLMALVEVITGDDKVAADIKGDAFGAFRRSSDFLTHEVFHSYRSETELMRYMKRLENRDLSLTHSMIALGSCTMKLNAAAELMPITWPQFAQMHPFAPDSQTKGYRQIISELEQDLCEITGFDAMSLQPNSGAQGEYAGLMVIRAYHLDRGDDQRTVCLIPSSAHGTNPASAVMAGMEVVVVACDDHGNVDLNDLRAKAQEHSAQLGAFMITYPSTHGVFEEEIREINDIIHQHGGQVYMDGANMNAQVGLTNPGNIGADVCHLNLHKTFAIPHGGGGPGMGPIGVKAHLAPYLPGSPVVSMAGEKAIQAISSAPWGSALILLISYGYIKMLGSKGLADATRYAILNANYIKSRLKSHYSILYTGKNGTVAHEMIVDCREFKHSVGIEVEDIAKRLIDYGFHAPTVSFPVAGTLMIEPTESESVQELDRFCDALIQIRQEIAEVASGSADAADNVLKNAPHTSLEVTGDEWEHAYSRQKAAYPLEWIRDAKFWPAVCRVDNAYGDRNLVCICPPTSSYANNEVVPG